MDHATLVAICLMLCRAETHSLTLHGNQNKFTTMISYRYISLYIPNPSLSDGRTLATM